jgi:parallel beta-helix repeat protein
MLRAGSGDNDIKNNTFVANRIGILVNGATDTALKDNVISESSLTGIRFNNAATGNSVKENLLTSNLSGIEFLVTPPLGSSVGNEFKGNAFDRQRMRAPGAVGRQHFQGQHLRGERRGRLLSAVL